MNKNTVTSAAKQKPRIVQVLIATAGILLIPFVAMQFDGGVNWTASDFIIMGVLLFVTGMLIDFAARSGGKHRGAAVAIILALFFWLWAELAVGVFTNWGS